MNDVKNMLVLGDQYYRAGDFQSCVKIYGQVLQHDPENTEALLMMGIVAYKQKNYDLSESFVKKSLERKSPLSFMAHKVLGDVFRMREMWDESIAHYKKSISLKSDSLEALNNLASIFINQGKGDEAAFYLKKVLAIKPDYHVALCNMAGIHEAKGNLAEAEKLYRKSISVRPDYAAAYFGMGSVSQKKGNEDEALEFFNTTIEYNPQHVEALTGIGDILKDRKNYDGAMDFYTRVARLTPRADIFAIIGFIYELKEAYDKAINSYQTALSIDKDFIRALRNLARLFSYFEYHERTYEYAMRGLALEPDDPMLVFCMGSALRGMGQSDEAITYFRKSLALEPEKGEIYPSLIMAMMFAGTYPPEEVTEVAMEFDRRITSKFLRSRPFLNDKDENRKLKIGYVSPDFRDHSVNYFFEHLLKSHNRNYFEIHAFSNVQVKDHVTERLMTEFDAWHDIKPLNDDEAADLIEMLGIDILVDLAGHTGDNCLGVFARKPAPVQATWLGYPATTGIKAIDYRITDIYADPPGMSETLYAENLWRLPHIFCCYDSQGKNPLVTTRSPVLDNGYVTFGCFNNYNKVSDMTLAAWGRILAGVPDARIMLEVKGLETDRFRKEILERFKKFNISPERLILEARKKENQYVLYNRIDIALDPFPGCGGATSMDTMWMGVPMISLAGTYFASRMGVTILENVGVPEFIAQNVDEYVEKSVTLANDQERLVSIRADLRKKTLNSPMMDKQLFAQDMEAAYRGMWREWCKK